MMYKKPLLDVSILCETALDPRVTKKLFAYFSPYKLAIHINIDEASPIRKVICIPKVSYNPIFSTEFSYFIKTQDQLYSILITLIHLAIKHLNQAGYHATGDALTIFIPSTPNDDLSYTFQWRLDY